MLLKTAMELRAGQHNYLNAITSRFDETHLIYYAIKTRYTVFACEVGVFLKTKSGFLCPAHHVLQSCVCTFCSTFKQPAVLPCV